MQEFFSVQSSRNILLNREEKEGGKRVCREVTISDLGLAQQEGGYGLFWLLAQAFWHPQGVRSWSCFNTRERSVIG